MFRSFFKALESFFARRRLRRANAQRARHYEKRLKVWEKEARRNGRPLAVIQGWMIAP